MIPRIPAGDTFTVNLDALARMRAAAALTASTGIEYGGVLLAFRLVDGSWVIESPEVETGTYHRFERRATEVSADAMRGIAWRLSEKEFVLTGEVAYAGEWHTHRPEHPWPSFADHGLFATESGAV